MRELTGRVAMVTGGAKGIGAAVTERLVALGAKVACCYHESKAAAEQLDKKLNEHGKSLLTIQVDVRDVRQIESAVKATVEYFGDSISILVNNAGDIIETTPFESVSEDLWDKVMDVNLKSVFLCSKYCLPGMKAKRYGRIVNISSLAARAGGGPGCLPYAVSKGGVETFTRGLAKEAAPYNITVNAVAPGVTDTDMIRRYDVCGGLDKLMPKIPLSRLGISEDVAGAVAFLASRDASYITGETIAVNGGLRMD